jgi:hypothetical protein
MAQIFIPDAVFQEIQKALPTSISADEFVLQAVQDKLSFEERKRRFYELSDRTRTAMMEKGLTEDDILADFEQFREKLSG